MKILFVGSGNHGKISPILKSQGDSLAAAGVEVEYFLIKGKGLKGYLEHTSPLKKYVKENRIDVIHAHYSLSAFAVSLAGVKPIVVSLMGSDVKATRLYKLVIRFFARFFHWRAIIVKSQDMYKDLRIKRALIVPNGVNLDLFKPMDKATCRHSLGWDVEKIHVLFPANPFRPEKDFVLAQKSVGLLDKNLEIKDVYPLRFRDSLRFNDFEVCAWQNCVFLIKDWDNIVLGVSQKEKSEKRILCRMERRDGEIRFKSLVDNAFIPEFNEKHGLGTRLCLIKIDSQNAYFNAAPVITNYENGNQIELPFPNENAHFDLRHGIAESDFVLADAVHKSDGDFLLSYYWKKDRKLSLIDSSGSLIWTIHLPKGYDNVYLVDEDWVVL